MKLRLLFVGKSGDPNLHAATERYVERAARFVPAELVFVKEETPGAKPDPARILGAEARRIEAKLAPRDWLVAVDEAGKQRSSAEFAAELRSWLDASPSAVVFVVGGAFGLDASVRRKARAILPLSRMTLPHQMARLVLVEQLYRAIASLHGVAYTK